VQDVRNKHASLLGTLPWSSNTHDRLCELNVIEQVLQRLRKPHVIQDCLEGLRVRGNSNPPIHGWVYRLHGRPSSATSVSAPAGHVELASPTTNAPLAAIRLGTFRT
jgi:carbonic anhydrase